jgi:DNA-binding transcriptional MerR regulator
MTSRRPATGNPDLPGVREVAQHDPDSLDPSPSNSEDAAPLEPLPEGQAGDTAPFRLEIADALPTTGPGPSPDSDSPLPDKEYFKIGEVARIVGVKPYVLRYWETEFKRDIRPDRTRSNQRMYRRKDVETFLEIKRLRYEENLEVTGARRKLRSPGRSDKAARTSRPAAADPSLPSTVAGAAEPSDILAIPAVPAAPASPWSDAVLGAISSGLKELLRIVDEDENRG